MLLYLAIINSDSDKEKFETIYTSYKSLMFLVADRILGNVRDSEDIVHDSFLKIAEIIEKISVPNCPKTRNLVVTIVERKAIDLYRQKKRRTLVNFDDAIVNVPSSEDLSESIEASSLAKAIALLPTKYRELILLKYDAGLSEREIANLLAMTEANVHKTIQRAKKKLAQILKDLED